MLQTSLILKCYILEHETYKRKFVDCSIEFMYIRLTYTRRLITCEKR